MAFFIRPNTFESPRPGIPGCPPLGLTAVNSVMLKVALDLERQRPKDQQDKIRFIDCQDSKQNAGRQFKGAVHMNLENAPDAFKVFQSTICDVPGIMHDLATADMIVVYCQFGQARSPATMVAYEKQVCLRDDRNVNQVVVLLDKGITEYAALDFRLLDTSAWVGPSKGKISAYINKQMGALDTPVVPKPGGQMPQPCGDLEDEVEAAVMWTDPA